MARSSVVRAFAVCLAAGFGLATQSARAGIIYNELVQGDLSDDRFVPTHFNLVPGSNELLGVMEGGNEQGLDRDYYSITIPEGHVLAQLVLTLYSSPDFAAFVAIQPGPIFPDDPETVTPDVLMGWWHFGVNDEFMDILPLIGSNGIGFTPPLPAGTYSFWAQQIDDYTDYAFDFVVEVPGPGSAVVLGAAGFMIGRRRRGAFRDCAAAQ